MHWFGKADGLKFASDRLQHEACFILPSLLSCLARPKQILDFASFPNYNAKGSGLPGFEPGWLRLDLGPKVQVGK
jgi:hypothetical protein